MEQTREDALTPKQRVAAELLGTGMKRKEAAEGAGVHQRTIENWLRNAAFCEERDKATDAMVAEMRSRAWAVIARQLDDEDRKVAQQAAGHVLKMAEGAQTKERNAEWTVRFLHAPEPGEVCHKQHEGD